MDSAPGEQRPVDSRGEEYQSRVSRFRFKSKRSRRKEDHYSDSDHNTKRRRHRDESGDEETSRSHRHHHPRRTKPEKEPRTPPLADPGAYNYDPHGDVDTEWYADVDSEAQFRESLFDALADDEGAAFWEGVYGQPMHVYPEPGKQEHDGPLERMTEEEYAAFVREEMYRRTREYLDEEWARRQAQRQAQKAEEERERARRKGRRRKERAHFDALFDNSVRQQEAKRARSQWEGVWERYCRRWDDLRSRKADEQSKDDEINIKRLLPWPVLSGKWKDVSKDNVKKFFSNAPSAGTDSKSVLKAERIRWHPDKIQQWFGSENVDAEVMQSVTAVFQVIDDMWMDLRNLS